MATKATPLGSTRRHWKQTLLIGAKLFDTSVRCASAAQRRLAMALLVMFLAVAASVPACGDSIHVNGPGGWFDENSGSYLDGYVPSTNSGWIEFESYSQGASGRFASGWLEKYNGSSLLDSNLSKSFFNPKTAIFAGQFNGWQESWKNGSYTFSYVSGTFTVRLYTQYNGGRWSYGTLGNGYIHTGTTVPEPTSFVFTGTGLAGLAVLVRKKLRPPLSGESLCGTRSPA